MKEKMQSVTHTAGKMTWFRLLRLTMFFLIQVTLFLPRSLHSELIISADADMNIASHELSRWFGNGTGVELRAGWRSQDDWDRFYSLGYLGFSGSRTVTTTFNQEIPLSLNVVTLWYNATYHLMPQVRIQPFLTLSGGPLYWKGTRGTVLADPEVGLPEIPEKVLEEWNMGFRLAVGLTVPAGEMLELEPALAYTFIPGSLWPTMQEFVELESVNSFQFLSLRLTMNVLF